MSKMDYETLEKISKLIDEYTADANAYCSFMKYAVEVQNRDNPSENEKTGMMLARHDANIAFQAAKDTHAKIIDLIER